MKRFSFLLGIVAFLLTPQASCGETGVIYFVLGSDTAVWNYPGGVNIYVHTNHFSPALYSDPAQRAYQAMDPAFRNQFVDSFGASLKLTWWMLVGSVYGQSDNTDVPVPNLMPLYLMQKYHGSALKQFGDELTLHYHTFLWSDYNHDGVAYWNQARSFHECRADFDKAIAQSLLEENVFTVTFRSGWHYMDNEWQSYINQLWPFNMDNDSPNKKDPGAEPFFNVIDWSEASLGFVPFHPATTNYQVPGDGVGWNVRSVKMPNVDQALIDSIFATALTGTNQVVSLWSHLPESFFLTEIARMDQLIHNSAANNPAVQFRYCTSIEAMQRWMGMTNRPPLQLIVNEQSRTGTTILHLNTSAPIFQPEPFVAIKDISENYRIIPCIATGVNSWDAILPMPRASIAKVGIAVTDPAGNLTTRILRYLPDDLYLDNLDPQYSEPKGTWNSTSNSAWGVDARMARLHPGETVAAQWILPVTQAGSYSIYLQVPVITNAEPNLLFTVRSGNSTSAQVRFLNASPQHGWVYLATVNLDQAMTNTLVMSATGTGPTDNFVVADVIKVSPLANSPRVISNVAVDPGETTASITWTTVSPTPSLIEYGEDMRYAQFSATNSILATNHVVTLQGLIPGTIYQFQIDSASDGLQFTSQGAFTPATAAQLIYTNTAAIFDLTSLWKFSTNNLDGSQWQLPGYDDSLWPSGPGLLWVDTRAEGPYPQVQPKGAQLPADARTDLPYVTYYFRKHFTFNGQKEISILVFTNYVDDGAVFYLNGTEIHRSNMEPSPAVIGNKTLATSTNCDGNATCPVVFRTSGSLLTNLFSGDNVLAVEVHNYSARSPDITFGSALSYAFPMAPAPELRWLRARDAVTFYWNGSGFTLQRAARLGGTDTKWENVSGTVIESPYTVTEATMGFYRLVRP